MKRVLLAGLFGLAAACGGTTDIQTVTLNDVPRAPAQPVAQGITITDTGFNAPQVTVATGSDVTWTNAGTVDHEVSFGDSTTASGKIAPGTTWTMRFTRAGQYPYYDPLHSELSGVVLVTP